MIKINCKDLQQCLTLYSIIIMAYSTIYCRGQDVETVIYQSIIHVQFCDPEMWPRTLTVMGLVCDKTTYHGEHFYQFMWKYDSDLWSKAQTSCKLTKFDPSLDLYVWPLPLIKSWVFTDTPNHDEHFQQVKRKYIPWFVKVMSRQGKNKIKIIIKKNDLQLWP